MDLAATLLAPFIQAVRHWKWALALIAGYTTLSLLGPMLQAKFHLPNTLDVGMLLHQVSVLPFALYFIPRFMVWMDAELKNENTNPQATWKEGFENRWILASGARLLLSLFVSLGLTTFVIPGLLFLFAFGWAPMRILLRGEKFTVSAQNSLAMSFQNRIGMLAVGGFMGLLYFAAILMMFLILALTFPHPTPLDRLSHPLWWGAYAAGGAMELFLTLALLGLFHHLEARSAISRNSSEAP